MEEFAQNTSPTAQGVRESLEILRKSHEPLGQNALSTRLDLLLLPFLRGIPTLEERVARLKTGLDFVATELSAEDQIIYRHVFREPTSKNVGPRRRDAAAEISQGRDPEKQIEEPAVRGKEKGMLGRVARELLDPNFEEQLDEQHPVARDTSNAEMAYPEDAFEMSSYSWDFIIDEDDPRKQIDRRVMQLQMTLPHQRVFGLRYYNDRVPPQPVEDGVTVDDAEQTYLGTFLDPIEGTSSGWWMHLFHLGQLKPPGEEVQVATTEQYFDEGEGEKKPHVTVAVRFDTLKTINLGIWVPTRFRHSVKAEARVVSDPYYGRHLVGSPWKLDVDDDGWVREEFTDCQKGLQYGIYLRNINIYKT
jgi:hypothetical protein